MSWGSRSGCRIRTPFNILSRDFGAIATNIGDTESQLKALRSPQAWAEWTGQAAGAFASRLSQLPGQLSQAQESYAAVAAALSGYAAGLRPVVSRLVTLSQEAEETESTLRNATAELNHVRYSGDHTALHYWENRVGDLTGSLAGLRHQVQSQVAEMDGLASHCVQQIGRAAPGAHSNVFSDLWHGTEKAGDYTRHLLDEDLVKPFSAYEKASVDLIEHPDAHTLGEFLQAAGDVIGVIGLVVGVVALGATLGLAIAASGGTLAVALAGVAEVAGEAVEVTGGMALVAHSGALVSNSVAVATHEKGATGVDVEESALSVAEDAGGQVVDGVVKAKVDGPPAEAQAIDEGYDVASGLGGSAADLALEAHRVSIPEVASAGPDVVSGLQVVSSGIQGLQGLPSAPLQGAAGTGIVQPAVSPASPAVVNIQHVSLSLQPSGAPGNAGAGAEMGIQ